MSSAAHRPGDPCTTAFVAHDVAVVGVVRRQMADELQESGIPADVVDDAELVLTELLTNACQHGRPNEHGEVEVSWCVLADRLRISVIDGGDVAHLRPQPLDDDALGGRGLHLVDYLCASWHTDNQDGTRVTGELELSAATVSA